MIVHITNAMTCNAGSLNVAVYAAGNVHAGYATAVCEVGLGGYSACS